MRTTWLRALRRTPWYSFGAIVVVAVATALSTAIFAIVDGILFKPLPYPDPGRLFFVTGPAGYAASIRDIQTYAEAVPEARFAAYIPSVDSGALRRERPTSLRATAVDENYFDVLGLRPLIGGFARSHFEHSIGPVPGLLTYAMWQREFGGRVDIVGQRLPLAGARESDGSPVSAVDVVGVLGPNFAFPLDGDWAPDLVVPIRLDAEKRGSRASSGAAVLVRMPPGVSGSALRSRLDSVQLDPLEGAARRPAAGNGIEVTDIPTMRRQWRGVEGPSFGVACVVVVLAAVNVAGLGLARRRQQQREYAVRQALGANGRDLRRLALAENLPLVVAGVVLGLLGAPWLIRMAVALMPPGTPLLKMPGVDTRVLAFAVAQGLLVLATATLVHSRAFASSNVAQAIGTAFATPARWHRLAATSVVVQVAAAFVLTTAGTLAVSSLWRTWTQDPGYESDRGILLEVGLQSRSGAAQLPWLREIADQLRALPHVDAVGIVGAELLDGSARAFSLKRPAGARPGREQDLPVSEDLFAAMGIAPRRGRLPTPDELRTNAPVAVVSEQAAATLWPDQDPIGKVLERQSGRGSWTVIGVVPNAQYVSLGQTRFSQVYRPYAATPTASLVVRTSGSPSALLAAAMTRLGPAGSDVDLLRATTLREALGDTIRRQRLQGWIYGGFATAGLLITMLGVVARCAMAAAQRTRELGVRAALGATRPSLVWACVREAVTYVALGLVAGAVASAWGVALLQNALYQTSTYDLRLWAVAAVAVVATAAVGALLPSLRASRANPMTALRAE